MPKLTALQWIIVAAFQLFYGFAVFALTRDYYARRPPAPALSRQAAPNPHAGRPATPAAPAPPPGQLDLGSAIPESVVQKDPVLLAQLGDERFRQRQYQDAISIYRRVLEMRSDDVDTYNDLGLALHYSGDSEAALQILKQGAEKRPDFQRIWLTLGFVQVQTSEQGEAAFALRGAVRLDPANDVAGEAQRLLERLAQP